MNEFQELPENELCPCGSGKVYGECCKKKQFCYGISDGNIIRQIKITDEAAGAFEHLKSLFQEYYGRDPKQDEYVLAFMPVYNDRFLTENVYAMQKMCLEIVQADTEHPNAVLGVLRKRADYISDQEG